MNFPIKVHIKISEEADKAIKELAKAEQRSSANMLRVLLDEAIATRGKICDHVFSIRSVDESDIHNLNGPYMTVCTLCGHKPVKP